MNAKAATLLAAAEHLLAGALVVEVGTVRTSEEVPSDGWSTIHLAAAAENRGWRLVTIDCDGDASGACRSMLASRNLFPTFLVGDGADTLADLSDPIDLLYLDGSISPEETLAQFNAARLADPAVVVIDDVQQIDQEKYGKGTLLIPLLEQEGWSVEKHATEPGYLMAVATKSAAA